MVHTLTNGEEANMYEYCYRLVGTAKRKYWINSYNKEYCLLLNEFEGKEFLPLFMAKCRDKAIEHANAKVEGKSI